MLRKLVTRHDRYHMHKVLGTGALVSFIYHYCIVWPRTGALGASWPVLLLHLALSCTGLQFEVPARRIKKWPTIIWEEYRLHAVVFSCRSLAVAGLDGFPRVLGIAAVHVAADEVTRQWGQPGNTTVRGDGSSTSRRMWWMTRSYAVYQYLALASHLVGTNTLDLAYNTFIAIQSSAFCMTLHRKGLITHKTHARVYLVCIAVSAAFIVQSLSAVQLALALVCGYGRMQGLDKYPLWLMYWAITVGY